jgi:protein-S-isoprenylcysteine O-methyltransferase Ste14
MTLKYFLPLYLVAYVFAAFVWRTYRVWKQTGVIPVTFRAGDNAHDFIGRHFVLLFVLILAVVAVYSFSPSFYQFSLPVVWMEKPSAKMIGSAILMLSLAWTVVAQVQMGESWRIGIDREHRTPLMMSGVFSFSRNPIYVGMKLTLVGLFLVIPNAITLLTMVLGFVLIGVQVRLEEEFLTNTHGEVYLKYRSQVGRWFGRRRI